MGKTLTGILVVALAALALAAPANAFQPKAGSWFSGEVDPNDESNGSSIQFKVAKNRKKLTKFTIYWRCGDQSGYHSFRNPPIPIGINKKKRFKLVGATTPPAGQSTRDFTLKGRFVSSKKANYSMTLQGCGPKTTGRLRYAGS
ncbi:MAG: hypothetical protein R2725_14610 [Solirubrobacterales bacterium]